jgi:hypothetical protein
MGMFVVVSRIQDVWRSSHPYVYSGMFLAVLSVLAVAGAWTYGLLHFQEKSS